MYANVQNKSVYNDIRSVCTCIKRVCVCEWVNVEQHIVCMMRFTVVWAKAAAAAKAIAHEMNIKNDTYGTQQNVHMYTEKNEELEEEQSRRGKRRTRRRGSNRSRNCVMFCLFAVVMREIHVFSVCKYVWV